MTASQPQTQPLTPLPTGSWTVRPDRSELGFSVKHLGVATVHGRFGAFAGSLTVTDDPATTKAGGSVDVASVDTGDAHRDEHLVSSAFFEADEHPSITFAATDLIPARDGTVDIHGRLTLHGVTDAIVLHAAVQPPDDAGDTGSFALHVTATISRRAYGLRFRHAMGSGNRLVDDTVNVACTLVLAPTTS